MLNFIKQNFKKIFILLFLLFMLILVSSINYATITINNISDNVFRLHIIANSDLAKDQELKYKVRDSILEYINNSDIDTNKKSDIMLFVQNNKSDLYDIAKKVILENGFDYDVSISIGKFNFPTKTYADISLPAGTYDALRVEIGNANGQNWWCVMFPPLCFIDTTTGIVPEESKELLENNLDSEEYKLISDTSNSELQVKFKIVEFINSLID